MVAASPATERKITAFLFLLPFLVGVLGVMLALQSMFSLAIPAKIHAAMLLYAGLTWAFLSFDARRRRFRIFILATMAVAPWAMLPGRLTAGASQSTDWVLRLIAQHKGYAFQMLPTQVPAYDSLAMALFFGAVLLPVILLFGAAILLRGNPSVILLLLLPILEIGVFGGCIPSAFSIALLLMCAVSVIAIAQAEGKPAKRASVHDVRGIGSNRHAAAISGLAAAGLSAVLLAAAVLLLSETEYHTALRQSDLRAQAGQFLREAAAQHLFTQEEVQPPQGGMTGGRFENTGAFTFTGQTMMTVTTAPLKNSIYLKGYVGSMYTAEGWKPLADEQRGKGSEISNQTGAPQLPWQLLEADRALLGQVFLSELRTLEIKKTEAESSQTAFVPYFAKLQGLSEEGLPDSGRQEQTIVCGEPVNYSNNLFLKTRGEIQNALKNDLTQAKKGMTPNILNEYFSREETYAEFVHRVYLQLPEGFAEKAQNEFGDLSAIGSTEGIIKKVAGELSAREAYTLTPGDTPKGKDYAGYFLFENHKGYCTHFAAAATLLFRAAGIPARYAEGYVITGADDARAEAAGDGRHVISVRDTNAHAWCELYLDGLGWVPVEVTPGFTPVASAEKAFAGGEQITYEANGETAQNTISTTTPELQEQASQDTPEISGSGTASGTASGANLLLLLLCAASLLILFPAVLLMVRHRRAIRRRQAACDMEDRRGAVRALFSYWQEICRKSHPEEAFLKHRSLSDYALALPGEAASEVLGVIQKAAYSRAEITEEDFRTVHSFVQQERVRYFHETNWSKRILWKFMYNY